MWRWCALAALLQVARAAGAFSLVHPLPFMLFLRVQWHAATAPGVFGLWRFCILFGAWSQGCLSERPGDPATLRRGDDVCAFTFTLFGVGAVCDMTSGSISIASATSCELSTGAYTLADVTVAGTLNILGQVNITVTNSFVVTATGTVTGDSQGFASNTAGWGCVVSATTGVGGSLGGAGGRGSITGCGYYEFPTHMVRVLCVAAGVRAALCCIVPHSSLRTCVTHVNRVAAVRRRRAPVAVVAALSRSSQTRPRRRLW
jgi:hypothetical protein